MAGPSLASPLEQEPTISSEPTLDANALLEQLRDALQQWKASLRGANQVRAAEQLLNYVTDRREMIQYPKFQELGRQIGSGPTESMCKATTQRMALEALEQSGAWNAYWEMQLTLAV